MNFTSLTALSPLDGRYADKTNPLRAIFSEQGLIRQRVRVEALWFKALAQEQNITELNNLPVAVMQVLEQCAQGISAQDAATVKQLERTTNHDVKAVEYLVKSHLDTLPEGALKREFVHFACTSEDINNLSYALMLKEARETVLLPQLDALITHLRAMAHQYAAQPMLSRTHGQAATPTTLGKELANFTFRLQRQRQQFSEVAIMGKINGAVGNWNAHVVAYPNVDWLQLSERFVCALQLEWNRYTTQIEPHDWIAEYCDVLARINTILIDLCRDMWGYISLGYFKQRVIAGETGSSTMPHKVNPIDFENGEGNLGLANALLRFFADKLPISRWQRDLTDSTVLRNVGTALTYSHLAWQAIDRGLDRVTADPEKMAAELNANWELLAEPIQTVMRRYGIADAYEQLKQLTRGTRVDATTLHAFIQQLNLPIEAKAALQQLTPENYIGLATQLALSV